MEILQIQETLLLICFSDIDLILLRTNCQIKLFLVGVFLQLSARRVSLACSK